MRHRRDERGALVAMVAMLLAVLIPSAAFAVDLGMQRVVRRDMQALADVVALDMARLLDGRTAAAVTGDPTWAATQANAVAHNDGTLGEPPSVTVETGQLDTATGTFTPVSGSQVPDAVRVTASGRVDFAFHTGSGRATRVSIAMSDSTACFAVGSYAARVEEEMAASATGHVSATAQAGNLSAVVELMTDIHAGYGSVGLDVLSYEGLADAQVSLVELAAALNAGSVTGLAGATVTLEDFYLAVAQVLGDNGNTTDAAVLETLSTSLSSAGSIDLGQLLAIDQGGGNGIEGNANVLDLVAGSAFLFNGTNTLDVPGMSAGVPGLAYLDGELQLIQGPQIGCARRDTATLAETSQFSAAVSATLASSALNDMTLALGSIVANVSVASQNSTQITGSVQLAHTEGRLTDVACPNAASNANLLEIETTSHLLHAELHAPLRITAEVGVAPLITSSVVIDVQFNAVAQDDPYTTSTTITIPPQAYDTAYSTGHGEFRLANGTVTYSASVVSRTGLAFADDLVGNARIEQIVSSVAAGQFQDILADVDEQLLAPYADLLGLRLGGADVFALSRARPSCTSPSLRG